MTIAFDVASASSGTAGDHSYTHTPVGTPKGVFWLCVQNTASSQIASVTYGGVALSHISGSPLLGTAGDEPLTIYAMHLGTGIPTGPQTLAVDTTSTSAKTSLTFTVTAAADTEYDSSITLDAVQANPSMTLATTASTNTFVVGVLGSGDNSLAALSVGAGYTQLVESAMVTNTKIASMMYRTANPSGGNVTVNWTDANSEDAYAIGAGIREAGGAPSSSVDPFGTSGFFGG